ANVVAPGYIKTQLTDAIPEEAQQQMLGLTPLGRFGEPEDVAATVAFLASADAAIYAGQTLGPNSGDVML
ncbi:MAG: SDR family oxidoreductase, partial [Rhizobiaceae bacterium]|nr:SDR family oxidoreductase [Rhizobiaceae bacterium]